MKPRSTRGFTLLEMATVLVLISILAAMSIGGLEGMNKRSSFGSASGDLVSGLRRTQAEAAARGVFTAFIINTASTGAYASQWWGIETTSTFDVSTFDPANPAGPGKLIVSGTLPSGMTFGPAAGWNAALPQPLTAIPTLPGQSPAKPYCSFCLTNGMGSMLFESGAPVVFSAAPSRFGEQFSIQGVAGSTTRTLVVAVVMRTGLIEAVDR